MRYSDDGRYGGGDDYVRIQRKLKPKEISELQTGLQTAPAEQAPYPQLVADHNNFALAAGRRHLFTTDASRTITGFANVGDEISVIANRGSQDLVLANNSGSSTAENRILTHTLGNITLGPNESVFIYYDNESLRVRTVGF